MLARFSQQFTKQYDRAPEKIQRAFDERLRLFLQEPFHPLLSNHPLTGEWKVSRSINITGDWRAVFQELKNEETILFVALGTHSQLYS